MPITYEEFEQMYGQKIKVVLPEAEFMPGALKLLKHLKKHNIPAAVATSSSKIGYAVSKLKFLT